MFDDSAKLISRTRLKGADGLRGFAALWVVLFHIWGAVQRRDTEWVPHVIERFFDLGFLGVDIFFVLSGFVITYSLIGKPIDYYFVPKFIMRRSIRIDPPYWATIALAIAFLATKNILFSEHQERLPRFENIVIHVFYLQDLLDYPAISSVFWTLCLEFQFYILFSISVWVIYRTSFRYIDKVPISFIVLSLIIMTASPYLRFTENSMLIQGTIVPYLYQFLLGVFSCLYLLGRFKIMELCSLLLVVFSITVSLKSIIYAIVPLVTVLILIGSSKQWGCFQFLVSRFFQLLGKISYSLYLTHAIVGWASASVLIRLFDGRFGFIGTIIIFILSIMVSLVFAYVFFHVIEKKFIELSKRFGVRSPKK